MGAFDNNIFADFGSKVGTSTPRGYDIRLSDYLPASPKGLAFNAAQTSSWGPRVANSAALPANSTSNATIASDTSLFNNGRTYGVNSVSHRIAGNSAVREVNNNGGQESSTLGDIWNGVKSMGKSFGKKYDKATLGETLKGVSDIGGLGLGYMSYLASRTALANQNRINNENLVMAKDQLYGAVDDTTGKRSKYTINQQVANSLKAGFR